MFEIDQLVKFTEKSRHGDWNKGELAEISDILAEVPDNQFTLYMVKSRLSNTEFWVYESEIAPTWEQLTLF